MAQQTAIDMLREVLYEESFLVFSYIEELGLFKKLKEIEKKQIQKAYNEGIFSEPEWRDAEKYYNETYTQTGTE